MGSRTPRRARTPDTGVLAEGDDALVALTWDDEAGATGVADIADLDEIGDAAGVDTTGARVSDWAGTELGDALVVTTPRDVGAGLVVPLVSGGDAPDLDPAAVQPLEVLVGDTDTDTDGRSVLDVDLPVELRGRVSEDELTLELVDGGPRTGTVTVGLPTGVVAADITDVDVTAQVFGDDELAVVVEGANLDGHDGAFVLAPGRVVQLRDGTTAADWIK